MKKIFPFLLLVLVACGDQKPSTPQRNSLFAAPAESKDQFDKIWPAEYGVYYGKAGVVFHYAQVSHKLLPFPIDSIVAAAAGLHQLAVVEANGNADILFRPSNDQYAFKKVPLTGAVNVAAQWQKFIFVTSDGSAYVVDEAELRPYKLNVPGKVVSAAAGLRITLLNDAGEVYEIPWQPNPNQPGLQTASQIASGSATKIIFPVPIASITASRNGFSFALDKDGWPYGWGWNWGFYYDKEVTKPVALKDFWSLKAPVSQIVCGDNTAHFISNGDLFGLGHNGQGEVGNGYENPKTVSSKAWDGNLSPDKVVKPVQIAPGRKFKQIAKATTLSYFTYAQETSGQWDAWGRGKGGVLGTGLFTPTLDQFKPNIADVATPVRVEIPLQGKEVTESFFTASNYPPAELEVIIPPTPRDTLPPPPVSKELFLTIHVYSDKTVSTAKAVNKKKILLTDVKVYTDGTKE